ncbi:transposase, partial [bacterium]|nr:transposase [bacterium]
KGIEMRINRSSQAEGAFGVIKQDMDYERARRKDLDHVSAECMFVCLGYERVL